MLKEGGGDSTRTPVFSPRGVLKQGGKVSTGRGSVQFSVGGRLKAGLQRRKGSFSIAIRLVYVSLHNQVGTCKPLSTRIPEIPTAREKGNQPQHETELASLRRCIARGQPCGSPSWVGRTAEQLGAAEPPSVPAAVRVSPADDIYGPLRFVLSFPRKSPFSAEKLSLDRHTRPLNLATCHGRSPVKTKRGNLSATDGHQEPSLIQQTGVQQEYEE